MMINRGKIFAFNFLKWKRFIHIATFLSFVVLCVFVIVFAFWMPGHYSYDGGNKIHIADAIFYGLVTWNILCLIFSGILFVCNVILFIKQRAISIVGDMIKELIPIVVVLWFTGFNLEILIYYFTLPLFFLKGY